MLIHIIPPILAVLVENSLHSMQKRQLNKFLSADFTLQGPLLTCKSTHPAPFAQLRETRYEGYQRV